MLVQTFSPEHPAIRAAVRHDYHQFVSAELPFREEFGYPPYAHLARMVIRGSREESVAPFADSLAESLRAAPAA